ncbi:MAG: biopolymer transporter ExbD [Phycisphaerales bacterium]
MHRARRHAESPRLDMMPLIDVVFLLLTFFVFAMVLMVRINADDIRLPQASGGEPVEERVAAVIALSQEGGLTLDGAPFDAANLADRLADLGDAQIYVAPDVRAPVGELFTLLERLRDAGVNDFRFLRQTVDESAANEPTGAGGVP